MQPHEYHHPDRPGELPHQPALTRYSSAPAGSAYLSALVDSVIAGSAVPAEFPNGGAAGPDQLLQAGSRHGSNTGAGFFPSGNTPFRSPGVLEASLAPAQAPRCYGPLEDLEPPHRQHHHHMSSVPEDLGGVGGHDAAATAAAAEAVGDAGPAHPSSSSLLFRHNSSPAGVFHQLMMDEHGFSGARAGGGLGVYPQHPGGLQFHGCTRKLRSQLSYPSRQDSLSSISEINMSNVAASSSNLHLGSDFQVGGSWDDGAMGFRRASSIVGDRQLGRDGSGDFISALDDVDPSFNLPGSSLETAAMEQLLQIQQDTVACKVRARRGCATHPRSIAERARRTRISEKLKKLQELVPNMDKQTNTADMLELAVQHIKGLQNQIQKLNDEQSNCLCKPGAYGR